MHKFGHPRKKVRVLLEKLGMWKDLKDLVGAVRLQLIDPTIMLAEKISAEELQNPQLVSHDSICWRARAMWKAFGTNGWYISVNVGKADKQVAFSNDDNVFAQHFQEQCQHFENLNSEEKLYRTAQFILNSYYLRI
jgi:hypothetical protein